MKLTPKQEEVFLGHLGAWEKHSVFAIYAGAGFGKSTILRAVQKAKGGKMLGIRDFVDAVARFEPLAMEEAFLEMVRQAWREHDTVLLDDFHLIEAVSSGSCGFNAYPRPNYLDAALRALAAEAEANGRRLVLAYAGNAAAGLYYYRHVEYLNRFALEDYDALLRAYLPGEVREHLDLAKIFRFAPKLNGHQIKDACLELGAVSELDTNKFIDYLRARGMQSNVDLQEVQQVDLSTLKGLDDILESLDANIVLPLENDALATEFQLTPKRGVLLAGPPGTGKTTIGRALAWRLKSKFFLIDGTVVAGSDNFYGRVHHIFEAAKENSPAVIFIDDGDVIFEDEDSSGFYRYLLTMLDGLESESRARICVMMTAMNVGSLPPALVRSGRIELWLETRLPDETARRQILEELATGLPDKMRDLDCAAVAAAAEGLTGADMKRLMEDGKLLFAHDFARGRELRAVTEYFLEAIGTVRQNRERYEAASKAAKPATNSDGYYPGMFEGEKD